jgi:hypothetical protein
MNNEFNLQRAIAGEPIETREGIPAEFVAYRPTLRSDSRLVVQVEDRLIMCRDDGKIYNGTSTSINDLRMKLVVKQVDWSKMPVDTLLITQAGYSRYFRGFMDDKVTYYAEGRTSESGGNCLIYRSTPSDIQISSNQPWKIWFGGEYPIPDGLEFEIITRNGNKFNCPNDTKGVYWLHDRAYKHTEVIAYRLTGKLIEGYKL